MIQESFSQSGQDRFVDAILGGKKDGVFLDVGCNHPVELSNTFALERQLGWRGLLIDRDEHCHTLCKKKRIATAIKEDAIELDWNDAISLALAWAESSKQTVIDYLSLDCDENTLPILKVLMSQIGLVNRFRVLTVETDCYRFGPGPRDAIDALLAQYGYDVLCRNVRSSGGEIYESWAVDPKLVNMEKAERFRSDGLIWSEILARA